MCACDPEAAFCARSQRRNAASALVHGSCPRLYLLHQESEWHNNKRSERKTLNDIDVREHVGVLRKSSVNLSKRPHGGVRSGEPTVEKVSLQHRCCCAQSRIASGEVRCQEALVFLRLSREHRDGN